MEPRLQVKMGTRLLVLLCMMGIGVIVAAAVIQFVPRDHLLAVITVQDVLAFILPAVTTLALIYRQPWRAMSLHRAPSARALLVVVTFYVVSLPAMNWLVTANQAISLPAALSGLEQSMRALEDSAAQTTRQILDMHSLGDLLACLIVVGVMAGLSEEILFRGAMLRLMQGGRLGKHAVVWIVAIVFSAFHMQFYGFFPRMVLGLWLGYLLVWTGSLWVPIIAHALNNSTVVVFTYLTNAGYLPEGYGDNLGLPALGAFPWVALVSFVASLALAIWSSHSFTHRAAPNG